MLAGNDPVSAVKTGRPRRLKPEAYSGEEQRQENSKALFDENDCCVSDAGSKTSSAKNSPTEFSRFFSKLYSGVFEIK